MHINYNRIFPYILVFIVIFSTGATAYLINYSKYLIMFNIFVYILVLFNLKQIKLNKINFILFCWTSSFFLISGFINLDSDFQHYIGRILILLLILLISTIIEKECFFRIYIKIMIVIALSSLFFYLLGILNQELVKSFSTINLENRVLYKNIYLYTYRYSPLALTQSAYLKNNSFFWEPGAYQAFLNLALMIELKKNGYKRVKIILLFLLTIITTFSTTGYIVLFFILLSSLDLRRLNKRNLIALGLIFFIVMISLLNLDTLLSKFNSESNSYISFYHRQIGIIQDLSVWMMNPFLGVGYSKYNLYQIVGSANSITSTLSKYGVVLLFTIAILNILFIKKISINRLQFIIYIIVFLILYSTENFLITPLFLILGFYSLENTFSKN